MVLAGSEDEGTVQYSEIEKFFGIASAIVWPRKFYSVESKWNALSEKELTSAVNQMFKSLPGVLVSLLNFSSASLRWIFDETDDDLPLLQKCGNSVFPSLQISNFLWITWTITLFSPRL